MPRRERGGTDGSAWTDLRAKVGRFAHAIEEDGGMSAREFDLIVIGAGAIGENVADRAVQGGLTAALVEAELVGGECSYFACMPSKALLRAGAVLRAAGDVDGAKQSLSGGVDPLGVLRRRDVIVHDWNDASQVDSVNRAGIELVRGHARFTGP